MITKNKKILIACGGTGGHVFPGVAIAETFAKLKPDISIVFAGTKRGLEGVVIPGMGWPLISVDSASIKDRRGLGRVLAYGRLPISLINAVKVLRRESVGVLLGIGGYAAGPLTMAASFLGIPTAILEPNAIAGFTNRVLGRFVKRVYIGFPEAAEFFPRSKVLMTGNPVRKDIIDLRNTKTFGSGDVTNIFCFGGSQGAVAINRSLIEALPHLAGSRKKISFVHQVGDRDDIDAIVSSYKKNNFKADVFKFSDKIWDFYKTADIIIGRGGAATIAEISVIGIPSILIPYPFAADDHQRANVSSLERFGGAVKIEQKELNGNRLAAEILKLNGERLAVMRASLLRYGRPDAAEKIAKDLLQLVTRNS